MANKLHSAPTSAREPSIFRTFQFDSNDVRLSDRDGEPWFVLADVCRVLEIGNPSDAARRLDDDEKTTLDSIEGRAGHGAQSLIIINESGLYSLILTSRKPAAKRFKKWVTSQVLPTIRRTGSYGQPDPAPSHLEQRFERVLTLAEKLVDALAITAASGPASPSIKPPGQGRPGKKRGKYFSVSEIILQVTGDTELPHRAPIAIGRNITQFCEDHDHASRMYKGKKIYPKSAVNSWLHRGGRDLILSSVEENGDG